MSDSNQCHQWNIIASQACNSKTKQAGRQGAASHDWNCQMREYCQRRMPTQKSGVIPDIMEKVPLEFPVSCVRFHNSVLVRDTSSLRHGVHRRVEEGATALVSCPQDRSECGSAAALARHQFGFQKRQLACEPMTLPWCSDSSLFCALQV